MKPHVRVKAPLRLLGAGVPYDAVPGDLIVGNRGAAAKVYEIKRLQVLLMEYAGNYDYGARPDSGCRVHNFR